MSPFEGLLAMVAQAQEVSAVEVPASELVSAISILEQAQRRMAALSGVLCAEVAARQAAKGRSVGSTASALGAELGVPAGQIRERITVGDRAGTPAGQALARGEIHAQQERQIAEAVSELPGDAPDEFRCAVSRELAEIASEGAGPRDLAHHGRALLARLDPTRSARQEELQQRRRALRAPAPGPDGLASMGLVCEPRLRALLDVVLARFARPGQCLTAVADPLTGQLPTPEALAAGDERTPEQRAYDALSHVLTLGLEAGVRRPKGLATIVVRVTAEQLDDPAAIVVSEAGTALSVRQAVSMAGELPWFISLLRTVDGDAREELHRIDIDRGAGRLGTRIQRLVLYAAHGGCTFPGCGAPAAACEFHHVHEHSRGGPTTVANGALGCPMHHAWVGELPHQWRTVRDPSRPGHPRWEPPAEDRLAA